MKCLRYFYSLYFLFLIGDSYGQNHDVQARITKVEEGLTLKLRRKGEPILKMNIKERMDFHKVKGMSIAVINNGKIEWSKGYGIRNAEGEIVDEKTIFQAGAISKLITASIAMTLVEDGKISLDENINNKLQSWKAPENDFTKDEKVTLRRILTHHAGLADVGMNNGGYLPYAKLPTVTNILKGEAPAFNPPITVNSVPGKSPRVAGEGYVIAQQLIEDIVKQPYQDYIENHFFNKLKMTYSSYRQNLPTQLLPFVATGHSKGKELQDKWKLHPAYGSGGLWSTPTNIAKFMIEIQNATMGKGKILSKKMANEMLTPQKGNETRGIGFYLNGKENELSFYHRGWSEGYTTYALAFKDTGQGIVMMTNADSEGYKLMMEVLRSVANEYGWTKNRCVEAAPTHEVEIVEMDKKQFDSYHGEYLLEGRKLGKVETINNQLCMNIEEKKIVKLYPIKEDEFITDDGNHLMFIRNSGQPSAGVMFKDPIIDYVAKRVDLNPTLVKTGH
jgi:CubicO group peptidase (beta-lactamase class C family)